MDEHLGDRLSAYVDGELVADDLAAVEAHLAACSACRDAVQDFRRLVSRARALDDRPPGTDLWPGIAERIGTPRAGVVPLASHRRRFAFSVPQLAAAGVALALLSAGGAVTVMRLVAPRAVAVAGPEAFAPPLHAADAAASYDTAIRELEMILAARRGDLDSTTVSTLEMSLAVIDRAIAQAREALERDPNDIYLNGHLQSTLDRKLDLLRRAAMLPRAS